MPSLTYLIGLFNGTVSLWLVSNLIVNRDRRSPVARTVKTCGQRMRRVIRGYSAGFVGSCHVFSAEPVLLQLSSEPLVGVSR